MREFIGEALGTFMLALSGCERANALTEDAGLYRCSVHRRHSCRVDIEYAVRTFYYPNPGATAVVSLPLAIGAEAFGTFLPVLMIFALTEGSNVGRPDDALAPVFIGLRAAACAPG